MEDDILEDLLGTSDLPSKTDTIQESISADKQKVQPNNKAKPNREDLWADTNIGKFKPDPSTFNKTGKSFILVLGGTPDADAQVKLSKIVSTLGSKNFVMRYQYTDTISYLKTLADMEGLTVESYLPWKKMAPELENVTKIFATKRAYEIASHYSPKFNSFPNAVRCFRANFIHALLGVKLDNPVNLAICWSECGSEKLTRDTDFKKIGNISNLIHPCTELNIPIYNIKNKESLEKLIEYIKSI